MILMPPSRNVAEKLMRLTLNIMRDNSQGFDGVIKDCRLLEASPGRCLLHFPVRDEALLSSHPVITGEGGDQGEPKKILSPGFLATLVDCGITCAQVEEDHKGFSQVRGRIGSSVNFNISFLQHARLGDDLLLDCRALRLDLELSRLECRITRRRNDKDSLMAVAEQSRYIPEGHHRQPKKIREQIELLESLEEEKRRWKGKEGERK